MELTERLRDFIGHDFKDVIFDIESNGLLPEHVDPPFCMDRIHCLVIKCARTQRVLEFVNNDEKDDIADGVAILMAAETIIGHNIMDFDIPAIRLIYEDFYPEARIVDTLVMVRMCFADQKERDFRMAATGKLEGRLIGTMGLESWGQRLGLHKGDYKKDREAELKAIHREKKIDAPTPEELHHYVWGMWNQEMHDYCINDVEINFLVWEKIETKNWSREATVLEHQIHALMIQQERNGFVFDIAKAEKLRDHFQEEYQKLADDAVAEIGRWHAPMKKHIDKDEPDHGENEHRRVWGNVEFPKKTMSRAKSRVKAIAENNYKKMLPDVYEGVPMVKIELKEFNPNSRPQIVDRLQTLYGWEPADFTEKGTAIVNDDILRELESDVPLAGKLAELFFFKKRLGQVADGKNGWLKLVRRDGCIHGRVNVGGTVSGRATHASPNVSQVPGVNAVEFKDKEKGEEFLEEHKDEVNSWGAPVIVSSKWKEAKGEWKIVTRGRTGEYGYDCRELFTVREGYKLMGCDLSGIEFRCLGNLTHPFDGGEITDVVLNGDIHQRNADMAGISRSDAKRLLYACVDMETQALTKEGWKHYEELRVGELVLTYNIEKDCQEWKPIQHLHYVEDADCVHIQGRGVDIVCTPDHRWPVLRRTTVDGIPTDVREYRRTDELCTHMRVIANSPFYGGNQSSYEFDADAGKYGLNWTQTLMDMGDNERGAFLSGFLCADGHFNTSNKWHLTQKYGEHYEAMLAAMYLHFPTRLSAYSHNAYDNITGKVEVCQSRTWGCQKLKITKTKRQPVWCMTTENGSFVMRRGNMVTQTGNCMYGGGDQKLGSIVEPFSSEARQQSIGKVMRSKLMSAMPSLQQAIRAIHKEMRHNSNTIAGLDGRRLYARSKHSALNLRLQSDGALIAKKWCLLVDDMYYDEGWDHGVGLDYYFCSWSHDEIQVAVREEIAEKSARIAEEAAPIAGEHFGFKCPVAAEANIGEHWGDTH